MERPPDDAQDERAESHEADEEHAPDEPEPGRADLLSVALLVFFVSLIGVVGALLLLPVLL